MRLSPVRACPAFRARLNWIVFFLASLAALAAPPSAAFGKYIQLDAVTDVKTRFSSGCLSVQELANIAQHRGIDVVIYGDRGRISLEYGIAPFERIFKKKNERPSIFTMGVSAYLSEIHTNDKSFPETLLAPAIEVAPFYFWTGNLFKKNLTAHNWHKRLFIVGLEHAGDYEQLPILNSNVSTKYTSRFIPAFLIYLALFLASAGLLFKRVYRKAGFFFMTIFLLLAVNNHPFRSSPFDQYSGDQGTGPYQELIDYAVSKGAMVFWSHLESTDGMGKDNSVRLKTFPHPEDLVLSKNYTGFQSIYDGVVHVTDPGKEWDQVLRSYMDGERSRPVWGYGGSNFQCEGKDESGKLGAIRTVLLVREKSRKAVFDAMRKGRMYAVRQFGDHRLSLDEFSISSVTAKKEAVMGEELVSAEIPELRINVRSTGGARDTIVLSLIRNGKLIKQETATLPYELVWKDVGVKREGKVFYRLIAKASSKDYLISNPIFVNFSGAAPQVASLPQSREEPVVVPPRKPSPPAPPKSPVPPAEVSAGKGTGPSAAKSPAAAEIMKIFRTMAADVAPSSSAVPRARGPAVPQPSEPTSPKAVAQPKVASKPAAPVFTPPSFPAKQVATKKFAVALIDGVSLKARPEIDSPLLATAKKGERLILLKRLKTSFNGKAWLEVKKGGQKMYVWEGLVRVD